MTTRAQLRALLRNELNDNAATKLWADADLHAWLNDAIRDYSRALPAERSTTIPMAPGTSTYALPTDCDTVIRVEEPPGELRVPIEQGDHAYSVWANQLLLDPAPRAATILTLRYLGRYAEPAADGDTLATPPTDDDLLLDLVVARALEWIDLDESKRLRFERQRAASPRPLAEARHARFLTAVQDRHRRVRTRTLLAN